MAARGAANGLVHDAFIYSSTEEFLAGCLPFIREGIARGEPTLAAPTADNVALLQRELGAAAGRVDWADDPEAHRPVQRLGIFLDYIDEHRRRGASRVRLLGEPVWPADSEAGVAEWKRYESFLNVALAPHPVWLVCPYSATDLPADIVGDACRTHPVMGHGSAREPSPEYLEPDAFSRRLDAQRQLPAPPAEAIERSFQDAADARLFAVEEARRAHVSVDRLVDVKLAVGEVATNVFRHAVGPARIRSWVAGRTFVCEVSDNGAGVDDPFAGYLMPQPPRPGGWGLAITRQVCDVVEIRGGSGGTTVRLHFA
jgi:anti-sigma regulatory factor (Ser/Thr protein kinase)